MFSHNYSSAYLLRYIFGAAAAALFYRASGNYTLLCTRAHRRTEFSVGLIARTHHARTYTPPLIALPSAEDDARESGRTGGRGERLYGLTHYHTLSFAFGTLGQIHCENTIFNINNIAVCGCGVNANMLVCVLLACMYVSVV